MTKTKSKRKREASPPAEDDQLVHEEPATEKFSPLRKLNFTKAFSPKTVTFSSKPAMKNLSVRVVCGGRHLLVVIPGAEQDGWIDNLNVGIALCKTLDMRGFKLPDDICGLNRFGYYSCFEDAQQTAKHLFDPKAKTLVPAGVKIGKSDPNATPPKVRCCTLRVRSNLHVY